MKSIILLLIASVLYILFAFYSNHSKTSQNFDTVYVYNKNSEYGLPIINDKFQIDSSVTCEKQLSNEQIALLNQILLKKPLKNDSVAGCFYPHHGIVYFKDTIPQKWISICFICNQLETSPNLQTKISPNQLSVFIKSINIECM